MAESLLCNLVGDRYDVHSAGIAAEDLGPRAIEIIRMQMETWVSTLGSLPEEVQYLLTHMLWIFTGQKS